MTESTTSVTVPTDRETALRKGYALADKELREKYADEFNALRVKHTKALGYDWEPKKSDEQVAEETVLALLAEYPHLREKITTTEEEGAAE